MGRDQQPHDQGTEVVLYAAQLEQLGSTQCQHQAIKDQQFSMAGQLASESVGEVGVLAGEIADWLPAVRQRLRGNQEV